MKATLEFDLPEEQEEFNITCNAMKMSCALDAHFNWLRNQIKHNPYELSTNEIAVLEMAQGNLRDEVGWMI